MSRGVERRPRRGVLRAVLFWSHLAAGAIAGIAILVMAVTGVLLTYERQIVAWLDGEPGVALPPPEAARRSLDTLLARAGVALGEIGGVTVSAEPTAPVTVRLHDRRTLLVNPYTGTTVTGGSQRTHDVFHYIEGWHRWLGTAGEHRAVARAVTGVANLLFLFLVASGFYLWWPRRWSVQTLRAALLPRRWLRGRAWDWNWHKVVGFWCAPVLFLVVLSGAFISYRWPGAALDLVFGETEPPVPRAARPSADRGRSAAPRLGVPLDSVVALAARRVPAWRTIGLILPSAQDTTIRATISTGDRARPDLRAQLTLSAATGAVVSWRPYESLGASRKLQSWMRWVHTGEAAGVVGQTLAGLASAGGAFLAWTGLALVWRRFRGRNRPRNPDGAQDWDGAETPEVGPSVAVPEAAARP